MIEQKIVRRLQQFTESIRNEFCGSVEAGGYSCQRPLDFGEIIQQLKKAIRDCADDDPHVFFDWGSAHPTGFSSFRGNYTHLCLEYSGSHSSEIRASKFLKICEEAMGEVFTGWKGGDYPSDSSSKVFVCCAGGISETRVVGIEVGDYYGIKIVTAESES